MLSVFLFIFTLVFKLLLYLFLIFVAVLIAGKLWFEPVNGVCRCTTRLDGKVALVTGGNSGIGLETARELARRGARVVIASRDRARSQLALADITRTTGSTLVEYRPLDLSKFSNVREFAENFKRSFPRLDILVNNSGAMGLKLQLTEDGMEKVTQINYLGAFLLTQLLLERLVAGSRIVVVSSLGHRVCSYDPDDVAGVKAFQRKDFFYSIYARSKLSQVLWTKALAKRLPSGVTVNALHPGVVKTEIYNSLPAFWLCGTCLVLDLLFKNAVEGAQTTVHLCVAPGLEGASGGYYADCRPAAVSSLAKHEILVENVWNESVILTKLK